MVSNNGRFGPVTRLTRAAVVVRLVGWKPWSNENPGEGGRLGVCLLSNGEEHPIGGCGRMLDRVEGGWKSRPYDTVARAGEVVVEEQLSYGISGLDITRWRRVGPWERYGRTPGRAVRNVMRNMAKGGKL